MHRVFPLLVTVCLLLGGGYLAYVLYQKYTLASTIKSSQLSILGL